MDILFVVVQIAAAFAALLLHDRYIAYKKKQQNIANVVKSATKKPKASGSTE